MPTVYIIIYSLYHHIYKVATSIEEGLKSQGVNVKLFQVPETLSEDILDKMHAPPKPDIPVITVDDLKDADGFLFGIPTRFGTMPAQIKSFLDATGGLWANGTLAGKFAGTFFSTASQHGGQETTAYTLVTYFTHLGMLYVPLGFANANLFDNSEVVGGSPYGAGTIANGDGSREPTQKELAIAVTQGENYGMILNTYHRGLEYNQQTHREAVVGVEEIEPEKVEREMEVEEVDRAEDGVVSNMEEVQVVNNAPSDKHESTERVEPTTVEHVIEERTTRSDVAQPMNLGSDSPQIHPATPLATSEVAVHTVTEPTATPAQTAAPTQPATATSPKQTKQRSVKAETPKKKHKCFCM